eukprot:12728827-Heterocapsa_arctica.AAC.1
MEARLKASAENTCAVVGLLLLQYCFCSNATLELSSKDRSGHAGDDEAGQGVALRLYQALSDRHVRASKTKTPKLPHEPVVKRTFLLELHVHLLDHGSPHAQSRVGTVASATQLWTIRKRRL